MRGTRVGVGCLGAFLFVTAGCATPDDRIPEIPDHHRRAFLDDLLAKVGLSSATQPDVKPPPHPEEYVPPPNDLRFTAPPVFPKEAQRDFQRSPDNPNGLDQPGKQGPRFGAGPGMGG